MSDDVPLRDTMAISSSGPGDFRNVPELVLDNGMIVRETEGEPSWHEVHDPATGLTTGRIYTIRQIRSCVDCLLQQREAAGKDGTG